MSMQDLHTKLAVERKAEDQPNYFPGQLLKPEWSPDKIVLAFAP